MMSVYLLIVGLVAALLILLAYVIMVVVFLNYLAEIEFLNISTSLQCYAKLIKLMLFMFFCAP